MTASTDAFKMLRAFMRKMAAWEKESMKLVDKVEQGKADIDDVSATQMKKLQTIQDEFCVASKSLRSSFTVESPAEYDLKSNKITRCEPVAEGKVEVEMRQTVGAETLVRIEMLAIAGEWKVSRRWMLFENKKPLACEL